MKSNKTKWWQYALLPFLWIVTGVMKVIMYLLYFQVRLMKSPLTKPMLDNFRIWNDDQEYAVKARSKDVFVLSVLWSLIHVWLWLPWYWLLIAIVAYAVAFLVILLYFLPKRIAE